MLFEHCRLTPSKRHLIEGVRRGIRNQSLRTIDLQGCLLHFREAGLDAELSEWGSAIAHVKRNRGLHWTWALGICATQIYYDHLDPYEPNVTPLPLVVFNTIVGLIQRTEDWQLRTDFGKPKEELLAIFHHLYAPMPLKRKNGQGVSRPQPEGAAFVELVKDGGNWEEDLKDVRAWIRYCEPIALDIAPEPMTSIVDAIDSAFATIDPRHRSFTINERLYLQLHLFVSVHNQLFDITPKMFKALTGEKLLDMNPKLTVTTGGEMLELAVGFFYLEKGGYLETRNIRTGDGFERFYYPILRSDLKVSEYLCESDDNIRACLFNHPLEVRNHAGRPVLVALERHRCRFKRTRSRHKPAPSWLETLGCRRR